ncbi:MAG TPA: hypothetical protein VD907_00670 [Verrucomicrobiae bacterium]|nr:hypothetical protein [Verrucomicrobiae bacterium]
MRLLLASMTSVVLCVLSALQLHAAPVVSPPPKPHLTAKPPIVITSFGGEATLEFVELYNQLDVAVNVTGWRVKLVVNDAEDTSKKLQFETPVLQGWLLPEKYTAYQRDADGTISTGFTVDEAQLATLESPVLQEVKLVDHQQVVRQSIVPGAALPGQWAQHKQRGKTSLTHTGIFTKDYTVKTDDAEIYSEPLYRPATTTEGLKIIEVLANPRQCSPAEVTISCGDYVKLQNTSSQPIDLARYRLRTGYHGQNPTVKNTFTWGREITNEEEYILSPGAYIVVAVQNNNAPEKPAPIELVNGGYIWLEDIKGVAVFGDSLVGHPSLDKGVSWAYDARTGNWRKGEPQPLGKNLFLPPQAAKTPVTAACKAGYYRHPETKRCRKQTSTSTAVLTPCKPGQTRHPETNRCRSAVLASDAADCRPGYARNPETNRCRKIAVAEATLVPCKPGQERHPETNRCRKIAATTAADQEIKTDTPPQPENMLGWGIGGAVAVGALGYAAYEWRQPIAGAFRRVSSIFRRPPQE